MHCSLMPPDPSHASPIPITLWLRRHAKFEVAEPIHCRIIVFLLLIHYFTLRPLTFDVDLGPWTFAVYRLWRDETLYQIWTQSSNPQQSYCDFSIWPYDLEHMFRVTLGSEIIIFHQVWPLTTYPFLNCSVFMLIRYVTLWPWPSTSWPWSR